MHKFTELKELIALKSSDNQTLANKLKEKDEEFNNLKHEHEILDTCLQK